MPSKTSQKKRERQSKSDPCYAPPTTTEVLRKKMKDNYRVGGLPMIHNRFGGHSHLIASYYSGTRTNHEDNVEKYILPWTEPGERLLAYRKATRGVAANEKEAVSHVNADEPVHVRKPVSSAPIGPKSASAKSWRKGGSQEASTSSGNRFRSEVMWSLPHASDEASRSLASEVAGAYKSCRTLPATSQPAKTTVKKDATSASRKHALDDNILSMPVQLKIWDDFRQVRAQNQNSSIPEWRAKLGNGPGGTNEAGMDRSNQAAPTKPSSTEHSDERSLHNCMLPSHTRSLPLPRNLPHTQPIVVLRSEEEVEELLAFSSQHNQVCADEQRHKNEQLAGKDLIPTQHASVPPAQLQAPPAAQHYQSQRVRATTVRTQPLLPHEPVKCRGEQSLGFYRSSVEDATINPHCHRQDGNLLGVRTQTAPEGAVHGGGGGGGGGANIPAIPTQGSEALARREEKLQHIRQLRNGDAWAKNHGRIGKVVKFKTPVATVAATEDTDGHVNRLMARIEAARLAAEADISRKDILVRGEQAAAEEEYEWNLDADEEQEQHLPWDRPADAMEMLRKKVARRDGREMKIKLEVYAQHRDEEKAEKMPGDPGSTEHNIAEPPSETGHAARDMTDPGIKDYNAKVNKWLDDHVLRLFPSALTNPDPSTASQNPNEKSPQLDRFTEDTPRGASAGFIADAGRMFKEGLSS